MASFEEVQELSIIMPDDFHHHFRDGEVLPDIVRHAQNFGRMLAMPNLKPPVRTTIEAIEYRKRILDSYPCHESFDVLMTLYLTDTTTSEEIIAAKNSGIVYAVKYYPAGATTNSEYGVTDLAKVKSVLRTMSDVHLPLLIHGEVTDASIDIFDRELEFLNTIMKPLILEFPQLKIVMEHITTAEAAEFISSLNSTNVAATITPHHLLHNRSDIFKGGIRPHLYCLPILKHERHRQALLAAATSGNSRFFLGTDSAPHAIHTKESACGCAGIFNGHASLELYAEAFESVGALDKLEGFASIFGSQFYGIPHNTKRVKLIKKSWSVPSTFSFGNSTLMPLRAGEMISWSIVDILS